jgi:PleD family two-component response regulator
VAGEDLSETIRRADEAMYRAKKMGRDRVEVQLAAPEREDQAA